MGRSVESIWLSGKALGAKLVNHQWTWYLEKLMLKGTVDKEHIEWHVRFTTVSLKLWMLKNGWDIDTFLFEIWFFFASGFSITGEFLVKK